MGRGGEFWVRSPLPPGFGVLLALGEPVGFDGITLYGACLLMN